MPYLCGVMVFRKRLKNIKKEGLLSETSGYLLKELSDDEKVR